jgi:hypothetical protein
VTFSDVVEQRGHDHIAVADTGSDHGQSCVIAMALVGDTLGEEEVCSLRG